MKTSNYNYFIPYGEKHIIFNGLTKRFFIVSDKNKAQFKEIISNPGKQDYQEKYAPFLERMKNEGFVLEDNVDEMELVRKEFERQRYPDQYMLMILPTYQCNLRCWYCIQEHQNVNMTDEMVIRIKKHIEKYLLENGIKRFRLSWFGGEPLLAYKKLTDITSFSKDLCKRHNISFFCDITTNSLLLTPERIKELGEIGASSFQITIDGCREKHNQVKQNKDNSTFDKAVNNVLEIVKNIPNANCTLRINYSEQTLEPGKIMHDVNLLIPHEYRKNIKITPCKIWQVKDSEISKEKVSELYSIVRRKSYKTNAIERALCYVDYRHFNCVFPNGRIGKCENEKLEKVKGILTEAGDIVWDTSYPFELHQSLEENSNCFHCKYLPYCMGPCPFKRDEMIGQFGKIVCQYSDADNAMENSIIRYCENSLNINN